MTGVVPEPGATLEDLLEGPPTANFALQSPGGEYGLYDFSSVMHYGSSAFADSTPTVLCDSVNGYTLWRRSSAPGTEDAVTYQREGLSFGAAVDFGDYDNDGDTDLLAAANGEVWANITQGRAYAFRATSGALNAWSSVGP